jgi:nucleotide-binding universal stress UspA family protein
MKRVLVPIDFSENSILAFKHGIAIANRLKSDLRVLHVKTGSHYAPEFAKDVVEVRINDRIESWMNWIFNQYGHLYNVQGGKMDYRVREGNVVQQIANQALYDDTTIIVMGSHGISGFTDKWIGSNAYRVVISAPCPVLVLRQDMTFDPDFTNIVIPVDIKKTSRKKLPIAAGVATLFQATVTLVGMRQTRIKYIIDQLVATMRQVEIYLTRRAGIKVDKSTILSGKNLPQKLIQYSVDIKADIIAIEVVDKSNPLIDLFRPFLNDLVNNSKCPVLAIPVKE